MSRHIVHQQAVEIKAIDRNTAQPLFLEISRLFNNRAKDVAGYVLDKYDRENELIKIDTLEVDIGAILFPISEESFVKVYSEKLEEALSGVIRKQLQLAEFKEQPSDPAVAQRSFLYVLEQFLLTGTIAWWAGKDELKDPVHIFQVLQEKEMPLLMAMMIRLFPEEKVRKRLVYSFMEENIKTVIGIIQPAEKEFIIRYHARVTYLQAEHHFIRTDSTGFGKALWLFILDFLADQSGSRFNRKMFVRSTLTAIALRFNVRFEQLLFFFSEAMKDIPENLRRKENLLSLVEEIVLEESQQLYTKAFGQPNFSDGLENASVLNIEELNAIDAMFFFLLNGFFPIGFQAKEGVSVNADLAAVIERNSDYARLFFLKHGKTHLVRRHLLTHFSDGSVKAVVKLMEPVGSGTIISYVSFISQFQRKTNFVKMEEHSLSQLLWDLILVHLFSERGTAFHAKSFLATNLQALAKHLKIDLLRLQAIIVQETVQQDSVTGDQASLSFLVSELFAENTGAKQAGRQTHTLKVVGLAPKNESELRSSETELFLSEIMDGSASVTGTVQKRFVFHVALNLLEFGVFPPWVRAGNLSVSMFINRMRVSYPQELRTAMEYTTRKGKTGISFLHHHASLFKTDLIFLFENAFPEKLRLFFQEIQAFHTLPDVFFAQSLLSALAESADGSPDLTVFFSALLKHVERAYGKEATKTIAFHAGTFSSLKDSRILKRAFNKAVKAYAFSGIPSNMKYSVGNLKQVLEISSLSGKWHTENELRDHLFTWIRYYISHKQLPSEISFPDLLSEKTFIVWALEFLFRNHEPKLKEFFSSDQITTGEQLEISDLLQSTGAGLEVRYFVEVQSRRQLIANEKALVKFDQNNPDSWKWLIKKIAALSPGPARETLTTLLSQESSRALIARYISDDELKQLFAKGSPPDLWLWYQHFREILMIVASDHFERQYLRKWILEFFLALFVGQLQVQLSAKELALHFVGFVSSRPDNIMVTIQERIVKPATMKNAGLSKSGKELMSHLAFAINGILRRNLTIKAMEEELNALERDLHFRLDAHEKKQLEQERQEKAIDTMKPKEDKALAMGEQVYVRNAGIVLLHPFIATLFARAGLTKDGGFTEETAQAKAVQLLQYAATGTEQDPEYELVLNKLLAGLMPEDILTNTTDLEPEEKELINGMLNAIVMQWDKMKNTSLEGFRNSFLMREGYIFQTEESWVLRVEQRGYDIILQTLPWSFGMIKFSWMTKPLIVEWN